jgi:hypothetical protein
MNRMKVANHVAAGSRPVLPAYLVIAKLLLR